MFDGCTDEQLRDIPDTAEEKFMFEMIGSKKNICVQASSSADKYQWMTAVRNCFRPPAYKHDIGSPRWVADLFNCAFQITEQITKMKTTAIALKQRQQK
jgi:hypothetical protein